MDKEISAEYARIKSLFEGVEPTKLELIDNLILKASFLKKELNILEINIKKYGSVERSNKGNIRQSLYFKTYLQSLTVYQTIIKTLNSVLGNEGINGDDEFETFIKSVNG